ncbi:cell division protein FtsQ/DivIB [Treponema primitia]|uniref:cell division protein FtsQ/DivIB n=1 Tax=Treponema primitia TaxID=88058 RepID=UPI0002555342|nr:FtsQ-type POTRA domain-containing protein [Treponema primitia]
MSEGFVFENTLPEENPVHSKMDRRLKWLLIALAVILAGELIWVLGVTPCMPLSVIEISGIPELDRGAVLTQAGIGVHTSYMTMDARGAELALGAMYQVESARVTKQFPDTVKIVLEKRKAVAMALAPINGKIEPVFFDRYGVVFKIGEDVAEGGIHTLPIISGLVFENTSLGMRLPALFQRFLTDLGRLNSSAPELLGTISEIQVKAKPYDGFELVLFPVHYPAKIRVGNELTQDTIRYMLLLIDVFIKQGVMVDEIDFRTGTASYKKEAALGQ